MREANKKIIEDLKLTVGSTIKIIQMNNHPDMNKKIGKIINITSDYQLQGTWGNYAVVPCVDKFTKIC